MSEGVVKKSHQAFGAFICAIGFALYVVVIARLGLFLPAWLEGASSAAGSGRPFIACIALMLNAWGLYVIFRSVNVFTRWKGSRDPLIWLIAWLVNLLSLLLPISKNRSGIIVGLMLAGGGAAMLIWAVPAIEPVPVTHEHYAVAFDWPKPDSKQDDRASAAASRGDESVLFWSVPNEQPSPRAGLLPMLLGSLLVIMFGLSYPRIALSEANNTADLLQKLVIPVLSLAVFGIGASQQADAADAVRDDRLVRQGLPPIHLLDHDVSVRMLGPDNLPPGTSAHLQDALERIERAILASDKPKDTDGKAVDLAPVVKSLDKIRGEIANPRASQAIVTINRLLTEIEQDVRKLKARPVPDPQAEAIGALNTALADRLDALKDQNCAIIALGANAKAQAAALETQRRKRAVQHLGRRMWNGLKGYDTGLANKDTGDRANDAKTAIEAEMAALGSACDHYKVPAPKPTPSKQGL